jgi:hypothetical protein
MSTDNVDTYSTVTSSEHLFQECCQFQPNLTMMQQLIRKMPTPGHLANVIATCYMLFGPY